MYLWQDRKTDERHVAGKLITEMATRLEDSSITSLEGLQNAGILNSTNMYVPDNFLLEKEKYLSCITNMISLPML